MSSEHPEIRKMIATLTTRILTCQDVLKPQAIGNAVYGMKHMSSEYAEVRGLLKVLADKIAESQDRLKPQHIGNTSTISPRTISPPSRRYDRRYYAPAPPSAPRYDCFGCFNPL